MARASSRKKPVKKNKTQNEGITFGRLRTYNFIAAALFLIQAVVVLFLSNSQNGTVQISSSFLARDPLASSAAGHNVLVSAVHHLFNLNLAYLVAAFFIISALAHLIIATWKRKAYEADLKRGVNRSRWIEYSLTASLMVVAVAILSGIFDFAALVMIFALTAVMSLLGMVMELRNQKARAVDWANYAVGTTAGAVPWLVIAYYIWNSHVYGNGVPGFVYWIFGSLLLLFASFAINMYLQYKRLGHWSTYLYGERAYILLSFIAKTALAWQIFAGTLR